MSTGACGINCEVCLLRVKGLCSPCGPGGSPQVIGKLAAQVRLLGRPCPILECAHKKSLPYCLKDCPDFPCTNFYQGPYPFSQAFLSMQERRREAITRKGEGGKKSMVDQIYWEEVASLDPMQTVQRTLGKWDPTLGYLIPFLKDLYIVDPRKRRIIPSSEANPVEPHLELVIVQYILNAKCLEPTGKMVTEKELPGGAFFFQSLHRLPTHYLEGVFGERPEAFIKAGEKLGGTVTEHGDASFELLTLPRIPLGFILWVKDEEFSSRCVITFDSSISQHLPLDAIWALVNVLCERLVSAAS